MVSRFQKSRWSPTRQQMHDMQSGDQKTFPGAEYFNVHSTVMRLNDAYCGGKTWSYARRGGVLVVRCESPSKS